ncbi:MAG TPA: M20/M25/M40 family metallo-hydrolase [Thermoanaerobaculia bacterium]|nr:M20/M25/M40 family metallo-hydrolase [Thermoanaerobaculia bacterium]
MRRALAVLLPLAVVLAIVLLRSDGPAPKGTDAPANEFSSARAMQVLRELLAENVPHPVASPANRRVRERIEARFRALGYETVVQRRFACSSGAACAMVENILARVPGAAKGDVLLLTGHYDSVAAGAGASDDGQGIATMLEVARAVRNERFVNRVAFLATDGEEIGLVGAEAFVADAELSKDVAAVISVEMRGTYGGSNMFETSSGNRWLIRHFANAVARPQASSVFYAVYKLLPNDTDVTVFRRAEMAAVNFAALRGVNWYHTALDDVAHASPKTLQHHGDNALAMLRTLGNADLQARSSTDATYFDVLALFLVWWPQEWTLWMAVISLVALLIAARKTDPRAMTFGVLAAFTALLIAGVGGQALSQLAQLKSSSMNFVARPLPGIVAMWLIGISGALFGAAIFNRRENPRALLYGIAIVWHMIGVALALTLGGAAYLFIVPAIVVSVLAWTHMSETAIATIALTVGAVLFFPLGTMLYEALGGRLMASVAVLIGALATLGAPLFPRMKYGAATAALALVAALVAIAQPAYTNDRPRMIPLFYMDDARTLPPRWVTSQVTEPLRAAAKFEAKDAASLAPWNRGATYAAPAPRQPMPRVTMTGERTGNLVTIRLRSPRNANRLMLLVNGGTIRRVNGLAPPPGRGRFSAMRGWQFASAAGVEEMVVEVAANRTVQAAASDLSFGLPPAGAALLRARAASTATTIQDGDTTITRVWGSW